MSHLLLFKGLLNEQHSLVGSISINTQKEKRKLP
jgi:hypothetical protein